MDPKLNKKLRRRGVDPAKHKLPKHIAISMGGNEEWARGNRKDLGQVYEMIFPKINELIKNQIELDIPILTIDLLNTKAKESEHFSVLMDALATFMDSLAGKMEIFERKIKISVFGKWYNLPSRVIEPIKRIIDETKDYDDFFLNLCINYDGQEEIVDACKLIGRRIQAGKIDFESIDHEMVKDNLYSSYFLPPDLSIATGTSRVKGSFLLWDSTTAIQYFSDIQWLDFEEDDFIDAIQFFQENKFG